jgi:hypothetical protein
MKRKYAPNPFKQYETKEWWAWREWMLRTPLGLSLREIPPALRW